MNCDREGATYHLACDCREDAICKEVTGLRERLAAAKKAREAWTETARMHAKNEAYYRDLIVRTLSGTPAAFVSDDGSVQQNVICAKLPELYEASEKARASDAVAHGSIAALCAGTGLPLSQHMTTV